jgi:hypothetical protein
MLVLTGLMRLDGEESSSIAVGVAVNVDLPSAASGDESGWLGDCFSSTPPPLVVSVGVWVVGVVAVAVDVVEGLAACAKGRRDFILVLRAAMRATRVRVRWKFPDTEGLVVVVVVRGL